MKGSLNYIFGVIVVFILVCLISCISESKYSKKNHLSTTLITEELYAETFQVDGYGVGGDVYSLYLTDSLSFRKFISVYYDHENFEYKIDGNEILIIKNEEIKRPISTNITKKVIEKYRFSVEGLREKRELD